MGLKFTHKSLYRKEAKDQGDRRRYEDGTLLTSKVEKGGHDPEDVGCLWKIKESKETYYVPAERRFRDIWQRAL